MIFENIVLGAHPVEDWEFQFSSGASMQITVDLEAGDQFEFSPTAPVAYFKLTEKMSPVDPEGTVPAEEIFIPMANVLCVRKSSRMFEPQSIEQREEYQNLLRELVNTPQLGN